jgi:DtxR family Mn-dependent transcriptional regulator
MVSEGFHPPVEEYLEAIYELEEEGVPVIRARLAERLGHAAPTVTENVKRLEEKGYVTASGKAVQMSTQGRRLAESVTRKHRLAERLLTDVIGLEWHKIHVEAGRWEHVISDDVEAKLQILLGHPTTCPHGNPIPGAAGPKRKLRPMSDLEAGDSVRLERVTERVEADLASLIYLDEHGFRPGASATIRTKAPDGTITVDIGGTTLAVGAGLAEQLFVSDVLEPA